MNDKLNVKRSDKNGRIRNNQRGALLIVLIISMVIISALGGATVYIFSSSTLNPVSGKYAQQAYYNAEAGFRYLTAVYRNEANSAAGRSAVITTFASPKTITLPSGGGTVTVTMSPLALAYTPVTATATLSGSDLVLSGISSPLPSPPGFFSIGTGTTVYRYLNRQLDTPASGQITLTGITPSGYTGGTIETREHTTITSVGTFGGSGLWNVNRKINYAWVLSGFPNAPGGQPGDPEDKFPKDFQKIVDDNPFKGTALGEFAVANVGGPAITVVSTTGGAAEAVLGYVADPNPFKQAWDNANKYLSYDIQIKIGTGVWTSGAFDKTAGGSNGKSVNNNGYIAGLTFRSTGNNPGLWNQLGLDFAKYNSTSDGGFPAKLRIYPDLIKSTTYAQNFIGWSTKPNQEKFVKCTNSAGCTVNSGNSLDNFGSDWVLYDPPPMILLWIRFGNATSAEDFWLAYMQLHQNSDSTKDEPNNGIVDASGYLKDWSTIMLRVVEGASLRFNSSTTGFVVGDTISNGSGALGMVVKKIQYNNSGTIQDVIILNNVTGSFTTGQSISSPNQTTAIPNVEYRARDNYIWAMFGDTDAHGTADTTAINDTRGANARIVSQADHNKITATNMNCYFHWPEMNIATWGTPILENCPTPQTVPNDYFKLVKWDALNTNQSTWDLPVNMLIMGTGKETNAILRTDQWTTGLYPTPFPYEIGFHSVGTSATKTYFDDLAINFPGQYIPGSTEYVPPSQY